MSKITTLFVDKGGVLVDNTALGPQYRRLLGEYLPTALGGVPDAWERANGDAFDRALGRYREASGSTTTTNIGEWFRQDIRLWLYDMCDAVGVPRPAASRADRIADAADAYVRQHADISAPRIVERLRGFHRRGVKLHVASGDRHLDLVRSLRAIGASDLFDRLYGSDLLNVWKSSAAYYRAIVTDTGIDPATALVVDDSERAIGWAAECGLRGVHVRRGESESFETAVLRAFDEVEDIRS